MKDYRLTEAEADGLSAWKIVNEVIYRPFEPRFDTWDLNQLAERLDGVDPLLVRIYSAWSSLSYDVVGGFDVILTHMSPSLIAAAAEGFDILGRPAAGESLRAFIRLFPGGQIPTEYSDAHDRLEQILGLLEEDAAIDEALSGFPVDADALDFTELLQRHKNHFIKPNEDRIVSILKCDTNSNGRGFSDWAASEDRSEKGGIGFIVR